MALPNISELLEEDLFKLLNIEDADDQKKLEILQTLTNTVDARVVNRIAETLSEEDAEQFGKLAEHGDQEALVKFLVDKEIDLPAIVSEEATRARVEFVELVRLAQEK